MDGSVVGEQVEGIGSWEEWDVERGDLEGSWCGENIDCVE
nr:MAG TPA: hypothetical protein [Caudoviricetes sp.]